jgi:transmembrane sensor
MTAQIGFEDAQLQRMEQAATWLQRMCTTRPDERLVEAWLDWCQRDPLNQQAFDEMAAIWELSAQIPLPQAAPGLAGGAAVPARRRALAASLAGLGLATLAAGAWWLARPAQEQMLTSELSSPIGINSTRRLADGSLLELGGGTRVTIVIGAHERRVELHEGELFVTVHHDSSRPFTVDAGKLEVLATGTAFNVLRTDERTTVTVAEGSVDALYADGVEAPNMRLQPSQQLVYAHETHSVLVRDANPGDATAWRSGTLYFQNEPLSEVIAKVNRYAARRIVIEDPQVGALSFTGTARTDRIQGWLQALPHIFPVSVVERASGSQLIAPRSDVRTD